ncbi:MAG: FUSC family protein [Eubacteriales bacterium]|nr:FUSC family protein [Eubacteriales bacterium]
MNSRKWHIPEVIKKNFRFSTLSFIFIILYVNIFQTVLGGENSIVGVIFTIMMSASMVRDLTATPLRHLAAQSLVLVWMAVAAYWVTVLPAPLSLFVNFTTLLLILYAFTYEYSSHKYFPYILSYLFLIFISPVNAQQLPRRILAMLVGAASIILYQWFMGRKRVQETARDVLTEMIDDICRFISYRLGREDKSPDLSDIRHKLCRLGQSVYDRRKKVLCISDAGFSMVAAGRGLEHLLILIHEMPEIKSQQEKNYLLEIWEQLKIYRSFLQQEITELPSFSNFPLSHESNGKNTRLFYNTLFYIHDRLTHMTDPQRKNRYRETALSFKLRLQAAIDWSPVRAIYALRTALLLSCATLAVQSLGLPHGKWLLFTLASVSLPYADDVPVKMKKRILATITGGIISVIIYSLVPSAAGRTAAMMLSGYVSFYFSDYTETFACSTVGALGGAVFMDAFGFRAVGSVLLIRLGYILIGAVAAYIANCLILPYNRSKATRQLWKKYTSAAELLTKICSGDHIDLQLYYNLVIQAYMLEEKLTQNARLEEWKDFPALLAQYQDMLRHAHRKMINGRADAPLFESGHLA